MDCSGNSAEDIEYMRFWLINEGNMALLKYFDDEKVDLAKTSVEFQTYAIRGGGRILGDEYTRTAVKGLFVAGEEAYATISSAAVFGWIAGEQAASYAKAAPESDIDKNISDIAKIREKVQSIRSRTYGPDWRDANMALQNTLADYAGLIRSQTMLEAGLEHFKRLKMKAHATLKAANQWELARCLEVLNLYDLGELVFLGALERKESRNLHQRIDYPYTDPLLNNKVLSIKKTGDKPLIQWKDIIK
jgi:succinate dehydrogenase/fumarate reductase flavoprotein subunit